MNYYKIATCIECVLRKDTKGLGLLSKIIFEVQCLLKLCCLSLLLTISSATHAQSTEGVSSIISLLLLGDEQSESNASLSEQAVVLDDTSGEIVAASEGNSNSNTQMLTISTDLNDELDIGSVLVVAPGIDDRFPLGFYGKVESVSQNGIDFDVEFSSPGLAEVFESVTLPASSIALKPEHLVQVIIPDGVVSNASLESNNKTFGSGGRSFKNGAVRVSNTTEVAPANSTVNSGFDLDINFRIPFKSLELEPNEGNSNVVVQLPEGFIIQGGFHNIVIEHGLDLKPTTDISEALKISKLILNSEAQLKVSMEGTPAFRIAYSSRLWESVEQKAIKLFGYKANFLGLSAQDKIGKIPLAGLVYSIPCPPPTGCLFGGRPPVTSAQYQPMTFFVWLYFDANVGITIGKNLDLLTINPAKIRSGFQKKSGGDFESIFEINRVNRDMPQVEMLQISDAGINIDGRLGISIGVDAIFHGVRFANVSAFIGTEASLGMNGSFGLERETFSSPLIYTGDFCTYGDTGLGAILTAGANVGIELETSWTQTDFGFGYHFEYPSPEARLNPGSTGLWFSRTSNFCSSSHETDLERVRSPGVVQAFTKLNASGQELGHDASAWSCVRDDVSGLIWEARADQSTSVAMTTTYRWGGISALGESASSPSGAYYDDWDSRVNLTNSETLCGRTNWRVPSKAEIRSIVDFDTHQPPVSATYFPNFPTGQNLWTREPYAPDSNLAWLINRTDGTDAFVNRHGSSAVILVSKGD